MPAIETLISKQCGYPALSAFQYFTLTFSGRGSGCMHLEAGASFQTKDTILCQQIAFLSSEERAHTALYRENAAQRSASSLEEPATFSYLGRVFLLALADALFTGGANKVSLKLDHDGFILKPCIVDTS